MTDIPSPLAVAAPTTTGPSRGTTWRTESSACAVSPLRRGHRVRSSVRRPRELWIQCRGEALAALSQELSSARREFPHRMTTQTSLDNEPSGTKFSTKPTDLRSAGPKTVAQFSAAPWHRSLEGLQEAPDQAAMDKLKFVHRGQPLKRPPSQRQQTQEPATHFAGVGNVIEYVSKRIAQRVGCVCKRIDLGGQQQIDYPGRDRREIGLPVLAARVDLPKPLQDRRALGSWVLGVLHGASLLPHAHLPIISKVGLHVKCR